MADVTVTLAKKPVRKILVVTHERSGTHFLMNSLALNLSYIARPWLNVDFEHGINFHSAEAFAGFFRLFQGKPVLNIGKSHHCFGFYENFAEQLMEEFQIIYVHRDPRDVMVSFWRLVNSLPWDEGPKTATPAEFMRRPPSGAMLRYQKHQAETILDRWADHLRGWTIDAPEPLRRNIIYLRFEDLRQNFQATVKDLADRLGLTCPAPRMPSPDRNVVLPGKGVVGGFHDHLDEPDLDFVQQRLGPELTRFLHRDPA